MTTPILVAGLGRCGSSMVMQMLSAAGVPCLGEYPAFEPEETNLPGRDPRVLLAIPKAMKILDPHRDLERWPWKIPARAIWLTRSPKEQAKSQVKFLRLAAGFEIPGQSWRAIRSGLLRDQRICSDWLDRFMPAPLSLTFEGILRQPLVASAAIASYLDLQPGVEERMAAVVVRRGPECQPGMEIELELCGRLAS